MAYAGMTWAAALAEAGCYGFLEPVAAEAVAVVLERCPSAAKLLSEGASKDLRSLCLRRLRSVYERPLLRLATKRAGLVETLLLNSGKEGAGQVMCDIAQAVRDEVMSDAGASLRASLPLALSYEQTIAANFVEAMAEFLDRLLLRRDEVSRELIGGRPITQVVGLSAGGADPHRHGRMVLRVETDAGSFFYKPRNCQIDALYLELVDAWFADCACAARLVLGEGYAFVERHVPAGLANEDELGRYWHNLGCLTALFHGLGSRDMTHDNLMCCGTRPAVLDLETLLVGAMAFDEAALEGTAAAFGVSPGGLADSVMCTSVLPQRIGGTFVSPLVADGPAGVCLPRVYGEPRTVSGFERDFTEGFEGGYRRLMAHREEVLAVLGRYDKAVCRQILLNTWAYAKARTLLFSPQALADPTKRDEVLEELNAAYGVFSPELREQVGEPDAVALMEGDIPYYCSQAGSRALYAGDGCALGNLLAQSALEVAQTRFARLSEDELRFELGLIHICLAAGEPSGGKS